MIGANMKEIYKVFYEALGDSLPFPIDNMIWTTIITTAIDMVAFRNAWKDVGFLYRMGMISGREAGSFLHWVIRTGRYLLLWGVVYAVIIAIKFIMHYWQMIVCGLLILMALAVIVCVARYKLRAKRMKLRCDGHISEE